MTRIDHTYAPLVTVETDETGANPRVSSVDWMQSWSNSHAYEDGARHWLTELEEDDPAVVAANAWMDQHHADADRALRGQPAPLEALLATELLQAKADAERAEQEAQALREDVTRLDALAARARSERDELQALANRREDHRASLIALAVLAVALVALLAWTGNRARLDADHERDLRRHACTELDAAGGDATTAEDVAACTFERQS